MLGTSEATNQIGGNFKPMDVFPILPKDINQEPLVATVAVITRTKDRPFLLRRSCDSVLNQTFDHWHQVIVNDGGAMAAVEEVIGERRQGYRDRITLIHHEKSLGMEAASNRGVQKIQAKYVAFLDDDDSWDPCFLQECIDFLENDPYGQKSAGVVCHSVIVNEELDKVDVREVDRVDFNSSLQVISLSQLLSVNRFPNNSFVFRRSVWDALGGFNEDLPVLGDWEFNVRVALNWEIGVLPKKLAFYHRRTNVQQTVYGNSVTGGTNSHTVFDNVLRNQLLRHELKNSSHSSIGYLSNFARMVEDTVVRSDAFQQRTEHLLSQINASALAHVQHFDRRLDDLAGQVNFVYKWSDRVILPFRLVGRAIQKVLRINRNSNSVAARR